MTGRTLIKPFFTQNLVRILIGLLCLVIVDFLQLFIPRIIKNAVDTLTAQTPSFHEITMDALAIVGIAAFIGVFRYVWRWCLIGLSRQVEAGLRSRLFSHVQRLSAVDFSRLKTGDIMSRATQDITQVRMAVGMGMVALTDTVVLGTAAIGFMLYIHVWLTVLALIPMPFIALTTRFFGSTMHRRSQEAQVAFATLTETVRERLTGIRIIQAYRMEGASSESVSKDSKQYVDRQLALVQVTRSFFPLMILLSNLSMAAVLYFGGRQTILKAITPGDFVAFISYLGLLAWPMMALGWLTNLVQRGRASLDRIVAVLEITPAIDPGAGGLPISNAAPEISFENIRFSYPGVTAGTDWALRDVEGTFAFGKFIGIAGPPGSGKSTLLRLLTRIYDPGEGSIRLGGIDTRKLELEALRGMFALVPQEPFLFSGTLQENIVSGSDSTGSKRLHEAADAAHLLSTIDGFPEKFETVVGERGVTLSGGQKQRVALARAFASTAPILVLDDPVSQVDAETGKEIIAKIRSLAGRKTIFMVSHRLSAIRHADEILVLDRGRITAKGTHDNLMAEDGYYARAARIQMIEGNGEA
jgi:ATP-binding cassette, subfamily B, multidrug efflux pump